MKKRIKNNVTGTLTTIVIYAILFIIQFGFLYYLANFLRDIYRTTQAIYFILDSLVALHILNDKTNDSTYKLASLFTIIILPLFGALLYILSKWDLIRNRFSSIVHESKEESFPLYKQDPEVLERLKEEDHLAYNTAKFLWNKESFPTYHNTQTQYFSQGEEYFEAILQELEKAKKFIFMEYFIIQEGYMWDKILEILERKVKEGVEVRVLFDGTSVITKLPLNFHKVLREKNIQARIFKPIIPVLSLYQNHRDHRKILVIDNQCVFTGGMNIADEYINKTTLFGHWKDSGTLTRGKSTRSFTILFLTMWNLKYKEKEDFLPYLLPEDESVVYDKDTYITPFGDDPYGDTRIAKEVYNDIINQGTDYLHIMTPYLILDEESIGDLIHLAQAGVDVKIITPHIPDKKLVFLVTRSYYKPLLREGIKIFEYTPGFIHSKSMVSDDRKAVVGTINYDYRSLYLHFECGSYYYDENLAKEVERDFQETLKVCQEFTYQDTKEFSYFERIMGRILRVFAPMM